MKIKKDIKEFLLAYKSETFNLLQISGDDYDIKEVIEGVKSDFEPDRVEVFFKDDAENVLSNLSMKTLFGAKLIIVYEVDSFPETYFKKIKEVIKNPAHLKPNIVVLTYKNKKRIPEIKDGLIGDFKVMYDSDIPTWIKRFVKKKGCSITEKAVQLLHFSCGTNREALKKQLDRIISIKEGKDTVVKEEDVKDIGFYREDTAFKITNSLIDGDYRAALHYFIEQSSNVPLFYYINRDLRRLLVIRAAVDLDEDIKGLDLKKRLGLHPYFLDNKYKPAVARLPYEKLERRYEKALDAEYSIRNGWNEFSVNFNFINQPQ
ncbi:MAG: hypothetical protein U9N06_06100 [candidate division WOR-3 bacterium]|nr:hypothetical protein [candidate division WOR-3 bacterium]